MNPPFHLTQRLEVLPKQYGELVCTPCGRYPCNPRFSGDCLRGALEKELAA